MKLSWQVLDKKILSKRSKNFWILLGPLSLLLGFLLLHCKTSLSLSLLSSISVIGYFLCWKFSFKGFFTSLLFMGIAALSLSSISSVSLGFWQLFWALSLCLTLLLITLSSDEYVKAKVQEEKLFEEKIDEIHTSHKSELENFSKLCDSQSTENKQLTQKIEALGDKIHTYNQFALAHKEESDKYFSEIEYLTEKIQLLQKQLAEAEEKSLEDKLQGDLVKKQRKLLNDIRVQNYQYRLLVEQQNKSGLEKTTQKSSNSSSFETAQKQEKIHLLEKDKEQLRQSYLEKMRSYEAIKEKFKTFFTMDEMLAFQDSDNSFQSKYEELKTSFQDLGQILTELRFDMFKIEGDILELKKQLPEATEEEVYQSYLSIADQECLRLEKENQVLTELLSENLIFSNKKRSMEL